MFSQLNKEGELGIRLPKAVGDVFKTEHQSTIFKSYGAMMKDYVLVPEQILNNTELLSSYLNEAYNYVMSLKPKPQKK